MKSAKILLCSAMIMTVFAVLSGCVNRDVPQQNEVPDDVDYQYFVDASDAERVPYRLTGEKDGWVINCIVKRLTEEEKNSIIQATLEEIEIKKQQYNEDSGISEEKFDTMIESLENKINDISNNNVYKSEIYGWYKGDQIEPNEKKIIYFSIKDSEGVERINGGVDVRSMSGAWYTAYNIESGEYFSNAFIPPIEDGIFTIEVSGVKTEIPLKLEKINVS